jgi:hypothetical protein
MLLAGLANPFLCWNTRDPIYETMTADAAMSLLRFLSSESGDGSTTNYDTTYMLVRY